MHLEMASERSENDSKMGPKMSPKWFQNGTPKWVPFWSSKKVQKYWFFIDV